MRRKTLVLAAGLIAVAGISATAGPIDISFEEASQRYVVQAGERLLTAYCVGGEFRDKPIFYPVLTLAGSAVNRFFPMEKGRPGETTDHPHHQSMWFTYGEVNGVDYWNLQPTGRRIRHREARAEGSTLHLSRDWIDPAGARVLAETDRVDFGLGEKVWWMDHDITLTADEADVHFGDSKEGAFGLRVADALREAGGSGRYLNAEGLETSANVWGKPSAWVALRGTVEGAAGPEPVTVAIFSHPESFNHPPFWHARDYGLFTVNPFGRRGYNAALSPRETHLKRGESLRLRFRLAVYGGVVEKARLDDDFAAFSR